MEYRGYLTTCLDFISRKHLKQKFNNEDNTLSDNLYNLLVSKPAVMEELRMEAAERCKRMVEAITRDFVLSYILFKEMGLVKTFMNKINDSGCVNARVGNAMALRSTFFDDFLAKTEKSSDPKSFHNKLFTSFSDEFRDSPDFTKKTWKALKEFLERVYNVGKQMGYIESFSLQQLINVTEVSVMKTNFLEKNDAGVDKNGHLIDDYVVLQG